jgi:hypothetical protein
MNEEKYGAAAVPMDYELQKTAQAQAHAQAQAAHAQAQAAHAQAHAQAQAAHAQAQAQAQAQAAHAQAQAQAAPVQTMETMSAARFLGEMQEMQSPDYDFGMLEDPNFAVPTKMEEGFVIQMAATAQNKEAKVRHIAREILDVYERFTLALREAQALYRSKLSKEKRRDYAEKDRNLKKVRAENKRAQQALNAQLTAFAAPPVDELSKRPRVEFGQKAVEAGEKAARASLA